MRRQGVTEVGKAGRVVAAGRRGVVHIVRGEGVGRPTVRAKVRVGGRRGDDGMWLDGFGVWYYEVIIVILIVDGSAVYRFVGSIVDGR